jgi:predicted transcriptional regulator
VSSDGISDNVKKFIFEYINSLEQLEVLLLLQAKWDKEWSAEEVSKELRIDASSAQARLDDLCEHEILTRGKASPAAYRYNPKKSDLDRAINELVDAYARQRVTVITQIFSKPIDKIRTFSDAFKFKKEE